MSRHRNAICVVVGGAGGAGLAAGAGLARAGYSVVVCEGQRAPFQKQSGTVNGGQARRHGGAYYANDPRVAADISRESSLLHNAPDCIVPITAYYFVPRHAKQLVTDGWSAAGVWCQESNEALKLPARALVASHDITAYETRDQVIDTQRLCRKLQLELKRAGGKLCCDAEIAGTSRQNNRVTAVHVHTPNGANWLKCDFFVNATGASLKKVAARVSPAADLARHFELSAAPELRMPWPVADQAPCVLQFYGEGFLDHLSIIPVGRSTRAAVCTRGGHRIEDPDSIPLDSEDAHERLLATLSAAFGTGVPRCDDQQLRWCVKALLTAPTRAPGAAAARLVSVIDGRDFGGLDNELYGSPGKLGSVFHFRDEVLRKVDQYFELGKRRAA